MPCDLCRFSVFAVFFYAAIVVSSAFIALGTYLAIQQQKAGIAQQFSIMPYVLILCSTTAGVIFAGLIWSAAGHPVTAYNPDREDLQRLAPIHAQKWTYQEHQYAGYVATVTAGIWHAVGLLACAHYVLVAWPRIGLGILPFLVYEVVGLIPVSLALKGWRLRRGKSND
jgi:hypothetical protein